MFIHLALLAGLFSAPAEAGVHVAISMPAVRFVIDPWSPAYAPAPRPGYTWVNGYYDVYGAWHPGYFRPTWSRPGYAWVDGYWHGTVWVDGYWRPYARAGYSWVPGYYHRGSWVEGYWYGRNHDRWYERASDRHAHAMTHEGRENQHASAYGEVADRDHDGHSRPSHDEDDHESHGGSQGTHGDSSHQSADTTSTSHGGGRAPSSDSADRRQGEKSAEGKREDRKREDRKPADRSSADRKSTERTSADRGERRDSGGKGKNR